MELPVLIYLANVLPNLQVLLGMGGGVIFAGCVMVAIMSEGDVVAPKAVFFASAFAVFLAVLIPSERTIWLMLGAHVGTEVAAMESTQEMIDHAQTIITDRLADLAAEAEAD